MLLAGEPDAIRAASEQLAAASRAMQAASESVAEHGRVVVADWTSLAAPLALARVEQDARDLLQAAEATNQAVAPLATYAEELRAAQQDHARAEATLAQGRAALEGVGSGAARAADAVREQARRAVDDARSLMDAAEERALVANETAARALAAASSALPGAPPATPPASATGGIGSTLAEMGNIAASLGNAALRNPLDGVAVLGGGALAAAGAVGALASVPLDATGVGAVAGLPLGGASVAAFAGGAGVAGAGLLDLATHAASDGRVAPFQVNAQSDSETPIADRLAQVGERGEQKRNRQLPNDEAVRDLADDVMEGGTPIQRGDYPGRWVVAADGTKIGLREESDSGGPTIDVERRDGRTWKIHRSLIR